MSIYERMQGRAKELMSRYAQGDVRYLEPGAKSGDPWNPTRGAETEHQLAATVRGVSQQYVDGTHILASDLEVRCAEFGTEPETAGHIQIDGERLEIVDVQAIPAAGTVVAWRLVVRA